MKIRMNQRGFSALEVALVVIVMGFVGGSGYYVYNQQQDVPEKTDSAPKNNSSSAPKVVKDQVFSLLDGKVTVTDDGTWKTATGGYWNAEKQLCGRSSEVTTESGEPSQGCLANLMLIPKSETFTNPDQFSVNISIFEDASTTAIKNGDDLQKWVDTEISPGGSNPTRLFSKINGNVAYRYEVAYSAKDVRLVHAIKAGNRVIAVRTYLFDGDWYSYESTTNYQTYRGAVDKLAESVTVK